MSDDKMIAYQLQKLSLSNFRSRFHLKENDFLYIQEKGLDVIEKHAFDFVEERLSSSYIPNDGKQTPMRGHPVFIAQHATGTCCRKCLYKWHHIERNVTLTMQEKIYIVNVIMAWIHQEVKNRKT